MDKELRDQLASTTLAMRRLLEDEFARQLEGVFDIFPNGQINERPSDTLTPEQRFTRAKIVASIERRRAKGEPQAESVYAYMRESAFTFLNRLAAFKMMEARGLVQECVSRGPESSGFKEFCGLAPGLTTLPDKGYQLYLESLCDEIGREVGALFTRSDSSSLLWPSRRVLEGVLATINEPSLASVWEGDETIGWIYQYYNDPAERKKMREESAAPRNSRELAVRNQFFTPRYVVEFLTDNTLGRIWYEMTRGATKLSEQCRYLVRRPTEIFLGDLKQAYDRAFGKPENGDYSFSAAVQAAYQGDLSKLSDDSGPDSRLVSLVIPPDQFQRITGEPYQPMGDDRLGKLMDDVVRGMPNPDASDPLVLWAALSRFTLNDGGGAYSIEPWRKLWTQFLSVARRPAPEATSQEDLLKQPVFIPHRPIKDPRTILMLDPACGSMHFGLYAFDLFEVIYVEAWALEEKFGADALSRPPEMKSLHDTYAGKDFFLKDVPRLIIEHNLHGIDIDPRCAQIAGLSLWLRAQKAWRRLDLKPADRPAIKRSNIVCAEPMPGEIEQLKEFCDALKQPAIGQMVAVIFDKMRLAGEAGSLLKIEEEIRELVHSTKLRWAETYRFDKSPAEFFTKAEIVAFSRAKKSNDPELDIDFAGIADEAFWDKAEERIYATLSDYAEQAEDGGGFQRRLFAEDAARGFAFIDVCRKRYDVALMNPPFGEGLEKTDALLQKHYKEVGRDLAATFIERGESLLGDAGTCGCIATRGLLIGHRLTDFRESHFFRSNQLRFVADLGSGVLDAAVEVACTVLESAKSSVGCPCFDLTAEHEKGDRLLFLIQSWSNGQLSEQASCLDLSVLGKLPDRVVTGWIPTWLSRLFSDVQPLDPNQACVVKGLITGDDFRFIRLFPEVAARQIGHSSSWVFFAKGGEYSPYHYDIQTLLGWESSGRELKAFARMTYDSESRTIKNQDRFGLAGISYSMSSSIGFSARIHPSGTVLADIGPVILPRQDVHPLSLLAYLNSTICIALLKVWQGGRRGRYHWISDSLQGVPTPKLDSLTASIQRVEAIVAILREASRFDEAGAHFVGTRLVGEGRLREQFESLRCRVESSALALARLAEEIDCQVADVLCVPNASLQSIKKLLFTETESTSSVYRQRFPESFATYVSECVSFWFGVALGRWDIRYATGEHAAPELPDPFAPLPVCPPGQLQNAQGLPARQEDVSAAYPVRIPWDGILVDDPNHPLDIERRVREVIEIIWSGQEGGPTAEAIEHEACELLGVKSLRDYCRKPAGFFADHLKRYSKSRRQAPIYWPLSSPKGLFSVWLYYHRLTADTFFTLLREVVKPRLDDEDRHLFNLKQSAGPSPTPSQAREISASSELTDDLRAFHDEVQRIAPLWKPNLNDGVIINHAPLWRLAPHAAWRISLKETWDELSKEEYDWAHLALHLWPERVIPKCATDRSLAIAHELDAFFWEEDPKSGKWISRKRKEADIRTLIAERSSPAVKAALESLLTAPAPSGGTAKKGRKAKTA